MRKNLTWEHRKNIMNKNDIVQMREISLRAKDVVVNNNGKEKPLGSETYWKGLDMASEDSNMSLSDRDYLKMISTSEIYSKIAFEFLDDVYLFNDQLVTKMPNEDFDFKPHQDSGFKSSFIGTDFDNLTIMIILDDFTKQNGTIECYDEDWKTLYPKSGDVVILNGTTLHRSSKNKSELPRSTYILHYTNGYYNPRYHRKRLK